MIFLFSYQILIYKVQVTTAVLYVMLMLWSARIKWPKLSTLVKSFKIVQKWYKFGFDILYMSIYILLVFNIFNTVVLQFFTLLKWTVSCWVSFFFFLISSDGHRGASLASWSNGTATWTGSCSAAFLNTPSDGWMRKRATGRSTPA